MQLYQMSIVAAGEVRDGDGNVISVDPVTGMAVVTEQQARDIVAAIENGDLK